MASPVAGGPAWTAGADVADVAEVSTMPEEDTATAAPPWTVEAEWRQRIYGDQPVAQPVPEVIPVPEVVEVGGFDEDAVPPLERPRRKVKRSKGTVDGFPAGSRKGDTRPIPIVVDDEPGSGMSGSDIPGSDIPGSDIPSSDIRGNDIPSSDIPGKDIPGNAVPVKVKSHSTKAHTKGKGKAKRAAREADQAAGSAGHGHGEGAAVQEVAERGSVMAGSAPARPDAAPRRSVKRPAARGSAERGSEGVARGPAFGRAERISLWLILRRCSGWLAIGGFVLLIAGMPEPSPLLVWFALALLLTVVGMGGLAYLAIPRVNRLEPKELLRRAPLFCAGAGLLVLGLFLLGIWTIALAVGSLGMQLLTPVLVLAAAASVVGWFGLWRMRVHGR
ncbi:hypothetical protein [Actinokineospora sp. NBRC 105648]|uniref:hypothetical protein n=1 Tax=Actinokineospora sp. NBRC 105648 TaxID=3032206 RepID=UPI00255276A7|nr:hypothetical protein [Actinokineospora sp. NBRC 105648]